MKKLFRNLITLLLLLTISVSAVACTGNDDESERQPERVKVKYTDGIHRFSHPNIDGKYILKDGVTDYALVIPSSPSTIEKNAISEFEYIFKMATNFGSFKTVTDDEVTYSDDAKYISFGRNKYLESSGLEYDLNELETDGVRILTKGNSVFLFGGVANGVIYAVYDFMQICFNYEFYYRNCVEIDKNVKNVPLKDFDVTDVPDIGGYRTIHTGESRSFNRTPTDVDYLVWGEDAVYNCDMRLYRDRTVGTSMINIYPDFPKTLSEATGGQAIHNVMEYIPQDKQGQEIVGEINGKKLGGLVEGNWLSQNKQLCYTAHGDEESLKRMKQFCADKIINSLYLHPVKDYPTSNFVTLTIEDEGQHCNCSECSRQMAQDANSKCGAIIRFLNDVRVLVDEWMYQPENEAYCRPQLQLTFFAYSAIPNPPVTYNEDEQCWEPAPNCEMIDGVGVYLAHMGDKRGSVIYSSNSQKYRDYFDGWGTLTDIMWIWNHTTESNNTTYFMDSLSSLNGDSYQYYAEAGVEYFFDEKVDQGTGNTRFMKLENYVQHKLMWDSTLDMDTLVQNFFNAFYKDAATTMYNFYFDVKMHHQSIHNMATVARKYTSKHYPYPVLKRFVEYTNKALEDIEHYRYTDPSLYEVLRDRINCEAVFPIWAIFEIYAKASDRPYNEEEREFYKSRLTEACNRYTFATVTEGGYLNNELGNI